jgi:purine-nucleoside phosphorylase
MLAYTGYYKNKRVTIFAHGMGIPSAGIYTYELFNFYKVDTIIRIGSCGSYKKDINVGDLVVVRDTVSDSVYADNLGVKVVDQTLVAPTRLLNLALSLAKQNNIDIKPVRTACSEAFYSALSLEQQAQL